ncbi:hypothetical protein B0H19DRAFT_1078168 [Mycena capillaripes]|nr:hypothetical protein B0H19DRAFT_1078168 [Mycena capillaripes]
MPATHRPSRRGTGKIESVEIIPTLGNCPIPFLLLTIHTSSQAWPRCCTKNEEKSIAVVQGMPGAAAAPGSRNYSDTVQQLNPFLVIDHPYLESSLALLLHQESLVLLLHQGVGIIPTLRLPHPFLVIDHPHLESSLAPLLHQKPGAATAPGKPGAAAAPVSRNYSDTVQLPHPFLVIDHPYLDWPRCCTRSDNLKKRRNAGHWCRESLVLLLHHCFAHNNPNQPLSRGQKSLQHPGCLEFVVKQRMSLRPVISCRPRGLPVRARLPCRPATVNASPRCSGYPSRNPIPFIFDEPFGMLLSCAAYYPLLGTGIMPDG